MKTLMPVLIATLFLSGCSSGGCSKQEWTSEDGRTQGGGWIWFPAKYQSPDLHQATVMAKVLALRDYAGECGAVFVKKLSFNEVCVQEPLFFIQSDYVVHLRLAAYYDTCQLSKKLYREKPPEKILASYKDKSLYDLFKEAEEKKWFSPKEKWWH